MAVIRDTAVTIEAAAATANMVCVMPTHEIGDLLIAFVGKDTASGFTTPSTGVGTPVSSSNWTLIRSSTSTGAGGGIYALRAASASENVTFPLTIETCCALLVSVKDVYGSTVTDAIPTSVAYAAEDATLPFAGVGITTASANALLFQHRFADTTVGTSYYPPWVNLFVGDSAAGGTTVAYSFEPTASTAVAAPNMWSGGEDDGKASAIEVKDEWQDLGVFGNLAITGTNVITKTGGTSFITSGVRVNGNITLATSEDTANNGTYTVSARTADTITVTGTLTNNADDDTMRIYIGSSTTKATRIPPYIPLDVTPSVQISPLTGNTGNIDKGTYVAAASIAITSVAGKTVSGVTIATSVDSGNNPFRGSSRNTGVSSTTNLCHVECNLTTAQDVTAGDLVFGTCLYNNPRDYLDTGSLAQGGKYMLLGSSSANWRAWIVGGQFCKTDRSDIRSNWLIQPSESATQYASAGTPNWASLDYFALGCSGYYGQASQLWSEMYELRTCVLAGGSPSYPFDLDGMILAVNNGCGYLPLMQQSGTAALVWIPLQIGGNEPIGIGIDLKTFQWPTKANIANKFADFHVAADKLGIEFYGTGSGDYIYFTNCLFTSASSYYWRFNSSHSASTVMSFSGTTVVGANVTLRSTVTLDNMSFINATAFALNSAAITNSSFSGTEVNTAVIAELGDVQDCSFLSAGTGHAIEVTGTAGNVTLTNLTYSGYSGTSTNAAIYINIGSGTCNITIAGGDVPSIRTAGATVNLIVNPVDVTVTVNDLDTGDPIENARLLVLVSNGDNFPYLDSVTITGAGTTATVTHTSHGLATGDNVLIAGANQDEYNGAYSITSTGTNTYTYTTPATVTATPATGTITATMAILNELTNASGIGTDNRSYTVDQAVEGWARKATGSPLYRQAPVSGTVDKDTGLSVTVFLAPDE